MQSLGPGAPWSVNDFGGALHSPQSGISNVNRLPWRNSEKSVPTFRNVSIRIRVAELDG